MEILNLVRKGYTIRVKISMMEHFTLKSISGCPIYNTMTKQLRE